MGHDPSITPPTPRVAENPASDVSTDDVRHPTARMTDDGCRMPTVRPFFYTED